MINTRLKVCYVTPLIMGSSTSAQQTNTQPLIKPPAKIQNPKPVHVHPKFSLGECIFTIDNPELYRDVECKIIFKYVVHDEVCKDIRRKVIKDMLNGVSHYTQWYLRTYIPTENEDKNHWYVFKTALGDARQEPRELRGARELEETIAIYKLNDFSYHIS